MYQGAVIKKCLNYQKEKEPTCEIKNKQKTNKHPNYIHFDINRIVIQ